MFTDEIDFCREKGKSLIWGFYAKFQIASFGSSSNSRLEGVTQWLFVIVFDNFGIGSSSVVAMLATV